MKGRTENTMKPMSRYLLCVSLCALAAGCSGGGYVGSPGSGVVASPGATATPTAPAGAQLTLGQSGAMPTQGLAGTFVLSLAEYDANKHLVTGTYLAPVTLTTNDGGDLSFTVTDPTGASTTSGASATITDSSASIIVNYDGNAVPKSTQISATSGNLGAALNFSPTSMGGSGGSAAVAKITIAQNGATPVEGSPGQFILSLTAYDSTNTPITGTYAAPIILTTNDATDLELATAPGGGGAGSIAISNSQTPVFVTYTGNYVPAGTEFTATSGTTTASLAFTTPTVRGLTTIAALYLTRNGALPVAGTPGASPVYVTAYDQNGRLIAGTLPSPVTVSLNNECPLSLSVGGSSVVSSNCQNVAGVIINNTDQIVYVNYGTNFPTNPEPELSASTADNVCTAITFPGNVEVPCPSPAAPVTSITRRTLARPGRM
jgi:hypothetical protein